MIIFSVKKYLHLFMVFSGLFSASVFASPDYFRLELPNHTTKANAQAFYCTAVPNKSENPRLFLATRAQMVTGLKNSNPNARGQLLIHAYSTEGNLGLNHVYFKAYQDPEELSLPGFIQIVGTGEVEITCALGDGDGNRVLMPGNYG